jgi:hypothetical protein
MALEALDIKSREKFDPRDLLAAVASVSVTHHGADTTMAVWSGFVARHVRTTLCCF